MRFLPRHLSAKILSASQHFKIILLLGARQTGKSTLLRHLFPHLKMIVFDPVQDLYNARKDPDQFLNLFPPPLILDEVQFVPELLAALKRRVDQKEEMGQYYLTGSQNFSMLKMVSESMAGRAALFNLDPFTALETVGLGEESSWLESYLDAPEAFMHSPIATLPMPSLNEFLFRGTLPHACSLPLKELQTFFLSYVQTYVERDIRLLENITDLTLFGNFLSLAANLTAQEINLSHLGRELGLSSQTARKWLNLLLHSYQWIEVMPYNTNSIKRLSDKRKGYFKDSGLACHLMRINSPDSLVTSSKMGALFEAWVVSNIKSYLSSSAMLYHWRSHGGAEVDLIIERDGFLYPIEIKCKSHPNSSDLSSLRAFKQTYPHLTIKPSLVIHGGEESYLLSEDTLALSWKAK